MTQRIAAPAPGSDAGPTAAWPSSAAAGQAPTIAGWAADLAAEASRAKHHSRETIFVTIDLPGAAIGAILESGLTSLKDRASVVWGRSADSSLLVGLGEAARFAGERGETLFDAMLVLREAAATAQVFATSAARPRFFGGARFDSAGTVHDDAWDGFGAWQFRLPAVLVALSATSASATLTVRTSAADTLEDLTARIRTVLEDALSPLGSPPLSEDLVPPQTAGRPFDWQGCVAEAIAEIACGRYEKVVLARQTRASIAVGVGTVLERLAERYPRCFVFKYAAGDSSFIGASPELLASLSEGVVRAASLAGSRPRGDDPASDRRLGAELLASAKDGLEHELVATALREALEPLCAELSAPRTPELMTQPNIHHLYTPFEGAVRPGVDILDVVARVHPTPAVGGSPRKEAIEAIDRLESMDRGWYAGPIGWMDFDGDGEFAVALRSGLIHRDQATLFAGAGIVEGSVPANELAETEVKLRPLREALRG